MFDLESYLLGLGLMASLALATWMISVLKRDVSIVDSLWFIFFLAGAIVYVLEGAHSDRAYLTLALVLIWSLRSAIYITARNWGEDEDRRYQAIRKRNEPHFAIKSLYIVFLLQVLLAWIVSLPLLATGVSAKPIGALDYIGATIALFGMTFEGIADWQLARFKADPNNRERVLDRGLWRYTRHPNYFGECCVWWGFFLLALATGAWWSVLSPLLMTTLLLKVSGVALLEKTIVRRRPDYQIYIEHTNAFVPGPRRSS
jgi:steroid 5-alpha reductase family enzyme